ncbi:uncharacterized protein N7511_002281 [Penicillium nucicola]|uniref:uncharacterized protein n=1 Tax=Penicillium nucicola TaxID=1850975 RepID=UPI0025452564|nr:uncharacterized protein N7511_002281 [Penicillium nucicola]KAJ5770230.1 hypothetical protein N7511_002281 [Penicillium nucicola]
MARPYPSMFAVRSMMAITIFCYRTIFGDGEKIRINLAYHDAGCTPFAAAPSDHGGAGDVDLRTDCKTCLDQ